MSRSCGSGAMVVGSGHRLPEDPCEYNPEASDGPGCNQLCCESCGARVRNSPGAQPGRRLYKCECDSWEEDATSYVVNDHESPADPRMSWVCGGHPAPELPLTLGGLTISAATDWPAVVQGILDGICPRPLAREGEGPWLWLSWLHGYLRGMPMASELSRAVGSRIADRDERVVGAVLIFFRRSPTADGIEHLLAHAMADPKRVMVRHAVREDDYEPSLWDVLIAMLQKRTNDNPARDAVDVIRSAMLCPVGRRDPLLQTLARSWEADAFRLDDAAWMAANIVALETAGPGRWEQLMNLVVAFARNDDELESMTVIAGVALINSRRVPAPEIRAWIKKRAYHTEAWPLVLQSALDKT